MKKRSSHLIPLFIALAIFACGAPIVTPEKRAAKARVNKGPIHIGVAWPFSVKQDDFKAGIELALSEINAQGGLLGRPVEVEFQDDKGNVETGKLVAQSFSENIDTLAVIGHYNSYISVPAAITYEYYGVLMVTPGSTTPKLTKQGLKYVCRTIPNDNEIGKQLAQHAFSQNYKKVLILHERGSYGKGLANAFELTANSLGIDIVDRYVYDGAQDLNQILERIRLLEFDSVFIGGYGQEANEIIITFRKNGLSAPFFGGDGLDTAALWKNEPKLIDGTVVLSVYHPDDPREAVQNLDQKFMAKFNRLPDAWAAQGYDTLNLLAKAIQDANSCEPLAVGKAFRAINGYEGATGTFNMNAEGDVVDKKMAPMVVQDQKFKYFTGSR